MSVSTPRVWVALEDSVVFLKITGRADFSSSTDFKKVMHGLRQRGYTQFTLDLSDCLIMDSTFLGVLAGIVTPAVPGANDATPPRLQLLNPKARVLDLLENLGILPLFQVISRAEPIDADFQSVPPASPPPNRIELARTALEAHQILMKLNPANIPKFKDVAKFLAEDLKKLEVQS
jgi:anti-sigma B factor antagonist